jgi:hypothetical protein
MNIFFLTSNKKKKIDKTIIKFNAKFPIIEATIDKKIIKFKKKIFFE